MPTAFIAEWRNKPSAGADAGGASGPIIGLLAEYDALPSLSQAVTTHQRPLTPGGPGHGCGHNLYGVACLGAALATQHAMRTHDLPGTLRYYGCPAEETLTGKTYMARDGVFDDLDAALTWHPSDVHTVWTHASLAMDSFRIHFHGTAAHAAAAPHHGRSALDAAILMDIGVNYLREHVPQDARIHSVLPHAGHAPNVVPPEATIWYYVRAPHRHDVDTLTKRVLDCAQGAALMTHTTYDVEYLTGCYDLLANPTISNVMLDALQRITPITYTQDELTFARDLQATIDPDTLHAARTQRQHAAAPGTTQDHVGNIMNTHTLTPNPTKATMHGSTEVGDVSYITPTGNLTTACHPIGTPAHSWQTTAASGHAIGHKGMHTAAKALALTAVDLLTKPELLQQAKQEFLDATQGKAYVSPLPEGAVAKV